MKAGKRGSNLFANLRFSDSGSSFRLEEEKEAVAELDLASSATALSQGVRLAVYV
jgi:hypothetical protein